MKPRPRNFWALLLVLYVRSDLYIKQANKTYNILNFFTKLQPAGRENLDLFLHKQFKRAQSVTEEAS